MPGLNVADQIAEAAHQNGVDPDFALRIARQESRLNPAVNASPKGAVGVMQLMPDTARGLGVDPHDVRQNIIGGVKYIRQLQDKFHGDEQLMAAGYNAGPGAVEKHGGVPPFKETRAYVKAVTGSAPAIQPPTAELDKLFGVQRAASQPEAPPAAPTAAAVPDQAELDKLFSVTRAPAPKAQPKLTASQAAAQKMAQASVQKDWLAQHPGVFNVVNSGWAGSLPFLAGKAEAAGTATRGALAHMGIGKADPYTAHDIDVATREANQHALTGYQQAHPYAGTAGQLAGFVAGGPVKLAAKIGEKAALRLAPKLATSGAGRMASRVAGAGTGGAAVGAGTAASQGQDAAGIAMSAAETGAASVPFGLLGEGLNAVAPKIPASRLVVPAATAAAGAAYGAATGGDVKGDALLGLALGAGRGGKAPEPTAEPTRAQRVKALEIVAKNTSPDALEAAHRPLTTFEAMGPSGHKLARTAGAAGNPPEGVTESINARQHPAAVMDRLSADLEGATGIAADTAKMDAEAHVEAARRGPGKQAYDAAITGKGVWTPELAQLASEPQVARAMNRARTILGARAMAPNPNAQTEAPFPPNMSAAELKSRMTQAGKVQPGQEVTTNDLLEYLKKGGPTTYSLAPKNPEQIPTDEMWDWTKKLLDKDVQYDGLGNPVPNAENHMQQHWSGEVRRATNDAIPGLKEARATAGEYLSFRQAQRNGEALWSSGKNAETGASFAKRWDGLTPAEQRATQMGYLAKAHTALEKGEFNLTRAQSPFHAAIQRKMFGAERAEQIQAAFAREAHLEQSARAIHSHLKPQVPAEEPHGGAAMGMMVAAGEHGLTPSALAHGAVAGAVGSGTRGIIRAFGKDAMHPGVRNALADLGAQPAHVTAGQMRARAREASSPASVTLKDLIAQDALRGVSLTAAAPSVQAAHALAGVSREDRR